MPVPKRKQLPRMKPEWAAVRMEEARDYTLSVIKPFHTHRSLSFRQIRTGMSSIENLIHTKEYKHYLGSYGDDYSLWESYQFILLACGTELYEQKPFNVASARYQIWRTVMLNFIRQNPNLPHTREESINREEGQTVKGQPE